MMMPVSPYDGPPGFLEARPRRVGCGPVCEEVEGSISCLLVEPHKTSGIAGAFREIPGRPVRGTAVSVAATESKWRAWRLSPVQLPRIP